MRTWIILILLVAPIAVSADTVYVLGDNVIQRVHGTVIGEVPGVSVSIRTLDGHELVFAADDIAGVVRGGTSPIYLNNYTLSATPNRRYREPSTALLYSLLIPGGGQFYNGETGKGFLQFMGATGGLLMFIANLPKYDHNGFQTDPGNVSMSKAGLGIALITSIWSIADAPASARRSNLERGLAQIKPVLDEKGMGFVVSWSF